jgi:hypothetical protein
MVLYIEIAIDFSKTAKATKSFSILKREDGPPNFGEYCDMGARLEAA